MLAFNNVKLIQHPEQYHGTGVKGPYFEGWYYKSVQKEGKGSLVFIPGVYVPEKGSSKGKRAEAHAFIMVLRNPKTSQCLYYSYPLSEFTAIAPPNNEFGYSFKIKDSTFSDKEIDVDLKSQDLVWTTEEDEQQFLEKVLKERVDLFPDLKMEQANYDRIPYSVKGRAVFKNIVPLPKTKYAPGIMGPFGYLPMMECYHGVVNVFHETYGSFEFTAESTDTIDLNNGSGYIEKDHGYNFPKSWIWIQSNCFKKHFGSTLMISVADVPLISDIGWTSRILKYVPYFGKKLLNACRINGFLVILYDKNTGITHNMSLYMGAKISDLTVELESIGNENYQNISLQFVQSNKELSVKIKRLLGFGVPLAGPSINGMGMDLMVEETLLATLSVELKVDDTIVFSDSAAEVGVEVVGDIKSMKKEV